MLSTHRENLVQQLKKYPIFYDFPSDELDKLIKQSEYFEALPGAILFQLHENSDCVYFLLDGYVELFSCNSCETKIASVRSGNFIGETSVLADEPHSFTARTNKLSQLIKIEKNVFLNFFQQDPKVLLNLTKSVAKRLRRMVMGLATENYPYKNIILYNTLPHIPLARFKEYFTPCALYDKVKIFDKNDFESSGLDIVPFLFQCESTPGVNIFLLDGQDSSWNKMVLLHAEYIYLVAPDNAWKHLPLPILQSENACPCDIVIWHHDQPPYTNTRGFYDQFPFKRHHHCRDEKASYERLYRFMTGQAIGLVISAGGFRGYAHYGLIKALLESKIPIDCISTCSFGAAIGACLAENFDWENFSHLYEKSMGRFRKKRLFNVNFTLPFTSLLSGKLPTEILQEVYQHRRIEDAAINFFCVTVNLSTREKELKHFGEIWEWLRASIAIPGIFPPLEKDGAIYVDGAIRTSLPIQDLRNYLDNSGKIICFDVRFSSKDKKNYDFPPVLSFTDMLAHRLGLSKKKYVLPNIFDILLESSFVEHYLYDNEGLKQADVVIAPDTSSLSFSNPSIGDPQSLIAYAFAKEKLKENQSLFERWLHKGSNF